MELSVPGLILLLSSVSASPVKVLGAPLFFEETVDTTPSCSQLRSFWNELSQSAQVSQLTNEIPLLPRELVDPVFRQSFVKSARPVGRHAGWPHRSSIQDVLLTSFGGATQFSNHESPFEDQSNDFHIQSPTISHSTPSRPLEQAELFGVFEPFESDPKPEPVSAGSFGSGAKKALFIDGFEPQWGSPDEVGTFGRFAKDGGNSPYVPTIGGATVDNRHVTINSAMHKQDAQQIPCVEILSKECSSQKQCSCPGWSPLHCVHGKCTQRHLLSGSMNDFGTWYGSPLPRSQLGLLSTLKKKKSRSIFM